MTIINTSVFFMHLLALLHDIPGVSENKMQNGTMPAICKDPGIVQLEEAFALDTHIVYGPSMLYERYAAAAFDGTNYMIVWAVQQGVPYGWELCGARVTIQGQLIDSAAIRITHEYGNEMNPAIAFDGVNFLVVWASGVNADIYGKRITPEGNVLDTVPFLIGVGDHLYDPAIAFGDSCYLVVWTQYYADIYGARVDPMGYVIDTVAFPISLGIGNYPSLAFDGTNFMVTWTDKRSNPEYGDIYGARITESGLLLDTAGIPISTAVWDQRNSRIAYNGSNYFVTWQDNRIDNQYDIYGARLSPSGYIIDSTGIVISDYPCVQEYPSVDGDDDNWLVTWTDCRVGSQYMIYGARVSQSGTVMDPNGFAICDTAYWQKNDVTLFNSIDYLVIWERYNSYTNIDIHCISVSPAGYIVDSASTIVSFAAGKQVFPSIASNGLDYFAVWDDYRNDSTASDIYGIRISRHGYSIDTTCIPICTDIGNQCQSSITFDGLYYIVVWADMRNDNSDIYCARISQSGVVLDPAGIAVCADVQSQGNPAIAASGSQSLMVWQDYRDLDGSAKIYGSRLSHDGTVLDPAGIAVSPPGNYHYRPAVAWDGMNFMVVWNKSDVTTKVYGTRIDENGILLDPTGFQISYGEGTCRGPSIAFDGTNCLVVWSQRELNLDFNIYGALVSNLGQPIDTVDIVISAHVDSQRFPDVTFNGTQYVIVWQDNGYGQSWDICGALMTLDGVLQDSFVISQQYGDQLNPEVAHGSQDQVLIAYSSWTDTVCSQPVYTMRIWGIVEPVVGIADDNDTNPKSASMNLRIYPNPVGNDCIFRYCMKQTAHVNITLYDILGRTVSCIVDDCKQPGDYRVTFNTENLPTGVYFVRMAAYNRILNKKIVIIKK